MNANTPGPPELEFMTDDSRAGFRLQRLEVLNWGTFDGRPWVVELNGHNSLLTGDIGSGKSTLVDAVTTLLIPSNRVAYNKAAGADTRERSLRTYIQGHYKAERSELTGGSKPVSLRDHTAYSVLLGVFHNEGYDQTVTLAQVFWRRSPTDAPSRAFVAVERELSIAEDFTGFGSEMRELRKRLRQSGVELFDSFPPYGSWFRRRFGIASPQALDLFHQTVSMKSVGNLTDFVRRHMLPEFDLAARIDALVDHFNDLNRAHEAVLKAKHQVSLLKPIVADADRHAAESGELDVFRSCRDALKAAMDVQRLDLVAAELSVLEERRRRQTVTIETLQEQRRAARTELEDVHRSITENGGGRLEFLASQIAARSADRDRRKSQADQLAERLERLGVAMPTSGDGFVSLRSNMDAELEAVDEAESEAQNRLTEHEVAMHGRRSDEAELAAEIADLEQRPNNIPAQQIQLRQALTEGTGIPADAMPFAGELVEVDGDEPRWEGAVERVLHNFGLSLLVADEHYSTVAGWVDQTHLRGRVVYFRVRADGRSDAGSRAEVDPDSLVNKVKVKPSSRFHDWVYDELARRFDYICCDDQKRFRRERFALTAAGQIKAGGRRHEKDDRHRIDDRRRFVLGWSNTAKLATLIDDHKKMQAEIADIGNLVASVRAEIDGLRTRRNDLAAVEHFRSFAEIDWASVAREVQSYEDERQALEASSDVLTQLRARQVELDSSVGTIESKLDEAREARARHDQKIEDRTEQHDLLVEATKEPAFADYEPWFERLAEFQAEALEGVIPTLGTIDKAEREVRSWLQGELDRVDSSLRRVTERVVRHMSSYCDLYPVESQEVTPSLASADEFRRMFNDLETDGLPGFEAQFKEQLNVNTIREIVNFQSQLHRERDNIGERIAQINNSLTKIDYNHGRYIALLADRSRDQEVEAFQHDLRACSEETLTGSDDDHYSEAKFLQVKAIVERFSGQAGQTELDKRWTAKVTDVRNWFDFNASERWREDDAEHEHYSDASGKSGGQKEKLAYTILAASLAYQFGLQWGETKSRTFRFVVIDEAFGRGSDESAQYGLRLFEELNLQLLIVTPLQKIHIIEPFVASVGYITNPDGRSSKVRNLTIEEYRAEKAERENQ